MSDFAPYGSKTPFFAELGLIAVTFAHLEEAVFDVIDAVCDSNLARVLLPPRHKMNFGSKCDLLKKLAERYLTQIAKSESNDDRAETLALIDATLKWIEECKQVAEGRNGAMHRRHLLRFGEEHTWERLLNDGLTQDITVGDLKDLRVAVGRCLFRAQRLAEGFHSRASRRIDAKLNAYSQADLEAWEAAQKGEC